jgi:hypothetical protein
MMRKPKFKSIPAYGSDEYSGQAGQRSRDAERDDREPSTGTAHSCAVSRSAATARTCRPNWVLLNSITIAATVNSVTDEDDEALPRDRPRHRVRTCRRRWG